MKSRRLKYYIQVTGIILIIINSTMKLVFNYQAPKALSYSIVVMATIYLFLIFKTGFISFYLLLKNRYR